MNRDDRGPARSNPTPDDYDAPLDACPLCAGRHTYRFHHDDKGRHIERCAECGVQFMNPQYRDEYLSAYYAAYTPGAGDCDPAAEEADRFQHDYLLDLIEERTGGPGRLLDVGCGRGGLLRAARDRGWRPTGCDVDPETVRRIAERHDLEIHAGELADLPLADRSFDVVAMNHVLEHLKDPGPAIDRVQSLLRPGGLLFVALPNIEGLSSRLKLDLERMGLRRRGVGAHYDADHHLLFFTPDTLSRFLAARGFDVFHRQSAPKIRAGESPRLRTLRRRTSDRLLLRSSFLVLAAQNRPM